MRPLFTGALLALASCTASHPVFAEHVTFDARVAKSFAAMIVEVIPQSTAWAWEDDATLSIADDNGKVLLQGSIPAGAWDGAMALLRSRDYEVLGRIINGAPLLGGDNTWPTTYYKGALTPVMFGWEDRVGALWEPRFKLAIDQDASDGDPVKQIEAWFGRQYNRRGGFCCSKADAYPFDGPYEFTADGGVTFQWHDTDGTPFTVDVSPDQLVQPKMQMVGDREVVVDGNPTGGAVIWYTGELHAGWNASLYCFAPGTLN